MPDNKLRLAHSMDQAMVRQANARAVLTEIVLHPNQSAALIAKKLDLGPQTVGRIISEFVEKGFVSQGQTAASGPGKPATPLQIVPNAVLAIGCEVGLEHCELLIYNVRAQTLGSHRWNYNIAEPAELRKQICSIVELLTNVVPAPDRSRITGLALAVPISLARQVREIGASAELAERWEGFDLAADLAAATGLKVTKYIDGSAACWGELAHLDVPRPGRLCYFYLSTFIIGGVLAEGRLLEGGTSRIADLGASLVPDEQGRLEQLNTVAGLQALIRDPSLRGVATLGTDPMEWNWPAMEPAVSRWLERAGKALAVAIVNASVTTGCQMAIIDATLPPPIIDRLIDSVRASIELLPSLPVQVQKGRAGVSAAARGAAALLMYRTYFSGDWEHFPSEIHA